MPSAVWSETEGVPLAAAIAAAVHHAWDGPERGRSTRFCTALRQMVGPETYEQVETLALHVFMQQTEPPAGLEIPPEWAWFQICPGCQKLRRTRHTIPIGGRVRLQVLRDPNWLATRFERGATYAALAMSLGCTSALVRYWAEKHGLSTRRVEEREAVEEAVARLHRTGKAPGEIARELGCKVEHVRKKLAKLGLATKKRGHAYMNAEWWRVRLQDRGMTTAEAARDAGIQRHAVSFWLHKYDLTHLTGGRTKPKKYPELSNAVSLYHLLQKHGESYADVAREVGCPETLVSHYARKLLNRKPKRGGSIHPHSRREWWTERLERGATTWELAGEAGVKEDTARERLRIFDLLAQGYANNAKRERERRNRGAA